MDRTRTPATRRGRQSILGGAAEGRFKELLAKEAPLRVQYEQAKAEKQ